MGRCCSAILLLHLLAVVLRRLPLLDRLRCCLSHLGVVLGSFASVTTSSSVCVAASAVSMVWVPRSAVVLAAMCGPCTIVALYGAVCQGVMQ